MYKHQFGDGYLVQAVENADLPIAMASKHAMLNTDIVSSDIPLFLSRKFMKRVGDDGELFLWYG